MELMAEPKALASADRAGAVVFYRCNRNASMATMT